MFFRNKVGQLLKKITSNKIRGQYAKAREAEGNFLEAAKSYEAAKDYENSIRFVTGIRFLVLCLVHDFWGFLIDYPLYLK